MGKKRKKRKKIQRSDSFQVLKEQPEVIFKKKPKSFLIRCVTACEFHSHKTSTYM